MSEYRGVEVFDERPRRRAVSRPRPTRSRGPGPQPAPRPRLRSRLGLFGLGAGVLTAAATITGISLALANRFEASILLAYLATGASVVAVLCGAASVVTGRGRRWGAIAILLGILSSPPVLTRLLAWASGLG